MVTSCMLAKTGLNFYCQTGAHQSAPHQSSGKASEDGATEVRKPRPQISTSWVNSYRMRKRNFILREDPQIPALWPLVRGRGFDLSRMEISSHRILLVFGWVSVTFLVVEPLYPGFMSVNIESAERPWCSPKPCSSKSVANFPTSLWLVLFFESDLSENERDDFSWIDTRFVLILKCIYIYIYYTQYIRVCKTNLSIPQHLAWNCRNAFCLVRRSWCWCHIRISYRIYPCNLEHGTHGILRWPPDHPNDLPFWLWLTVRHG